MKRHALDVTVLVLSAAMIVAAVLSLHAEDAEKLPALGADLSQTSVSGHMAGQIEVAHSSQIVGAGIVAGGPRRDRGEQARSVPMAVAQNA